jgi:hypothetical protein
VSAVGVGTSTGVSGGSQCTRADFSGMPLGKATFLAHLPYRQEAVKLEFCVLHVMHKETTVIDLNVAVRTTLLVVDDDIATKLVSPSS